MLRSNLPEKYVGGIGSAFGGGSGSGSGSGGNLLHRGIFEDWFDVVFFLVTLGTGVGLVVARSWGDDDDIGLEGKEV